MTEMLRDAPQAMAAQGWVDAGQPTAGVSTKNGPLCDRRRGACGIAALTPHNSENFLAPKAISTKWNRIAVRGPSALQGADDL